jgi:hypothetical protein
VPELRRLLNTLIPSPRPANRVQRRLVLVAPTTPGPGPRRALPSPRTGTPITAVAVLRSALGRVKSTVRLVLVILAALAVVLIQNPVTRQLLDDHGLRVTDGLGVSLVALILGVLFWEVHELSPKEVPVVDRHYSSQQAVYPQLIDKARNCRRNKDKSLDIIGGSLTTVWPLLKIWMNDTENHNWRIRLCALVDTPGRLSELVDPDAVVVARANLDDAVRHNKRLAQQGRGMEIAAYGYDFMSGVHGCRLGNGDLFFSVASWASGGLIDLTAHGYHFVPCDDRSGSANAIRESFEFWLVRATSSPWPPSSHNAEKD